MRIGFAVWGFRALLVVQMFEAGFEKAGIREPLGGKFDAHGVCRV